MTEEKDIDKKGRENKGTQTTSPSKGKFEDNISPAESESSEQSSESSEQSFSSSSDFEQSEHLKSQNNEINIPPNDIGDSEREKKQEEQKEGNIEDTVGFKDNADAYMVPSPATATKEAINDSPSIRDSIGFTPYVQALARMIIHPKTMTPLTIGIMGPWGSGKTSFMDQVKESISELDSKIKHVKFNAWKYDVKEELWAAFLQTIVSQIDNDLCLEQRWNLKLRSIWKKINKIAFFWNLIVTCVLFCIAYYYLNKLNIKLEWRLFVLIPFGVLGFLLNPLTKIWKKLIVPLGIDIAEMFSTNQFAENIANFNEFKSDLENILDSYIEAEGRLVIYIDDLDRCSPSKVVDVLETINVFLDTKRCIFLLGMDYPKVVMAINVKFKDHIEMLKKTNNGSDNVEEFGEGFLDKIVQIPIYVPKLGKKHIGEFLDEYFDHSVKKDIIDQSGKKDKIPTLKDFDIDDQVEMILKHAIECIEKNPRSIKKFLNIFRYVYLLYFANRDKFKDVVEYALPVWFLISYQNKDEMALIEKNHYEGTWGDVKSGFQNKYPKTKDLYQELEKNEEVNDLLRKLDGTLKGYFPLTGLLYD